MKYVVLCVAVAAIAFLLMFQTMERNKVGAVETAPRLQVAEDRFFCPGGRMARMGCEQTVYDHQLPPQG